MKKYSILFGALLSLLMLSSCKKWLDVKPRDKVVDEDLFSTQDGFFTALNGVYLGMSADKVYGGQLTMQMTEVLAQRYNIGADHFLYRLSTYQYTDPGVKKILANSWEGLYSNIANVNKIFSVIDEKQRLFTGDNYTLMKGELYALRAYLHFDAFRLYGPVYKNDSLQARVPYYDRFTPQYLPFLPGREVMDKVLKDLDSAMICLAKDPVITLGTRFSPDENDDNTWRYRSLRMNYFAVMALKARVYLYANNKPAALQTAKEVISRAGATFPLTTSVVGNGANPNRIFASELLFALQYRYINLAYMAYFSPDLGEKEILAAATNRLDNEFEKNENDPRYSKTWLIPSGNKKSYRCLYKYADIADMSLPYVNQIPMIRMSEMYFIAAECETDPVAAVADINVIRKARGVPDAATNAVISKELLKDYKREFYAEGQMFFYYKRNFTTSIPSGTGSGNKSLGVNEYTLPLPDSEIQFRN